MRYLLLLTTLICLSYSATSQSWRYYRHELSFGLGASNFLGELGGNDGIGLNGFKSVKDLEFALTRPVATIGYRFKINQMFAVRANFYQGRVDGDDARTDEPFRQNRNLHFKSPISELSGIFEFYPFGEKIDHPYRMSGAQGKKVRKLSPYLFGGIGGFFFNPKAKYQRSGKWQKLHQYQTEGVKYSRISAAISYGGGLKLALSKEWSIGFEFGMRKTFTDYIDDVSGSYIDNSTFSDPQAAWFADPNLGVTNVAPGPFDAGQQRGDASDLDSYMFAIFSVHYRLLKGRMHLPKF